jgi:asparagine synthase (glutamine-hydrolysing)
LAFDKECRRLLSDIHYFDVLRSDRSISSHGLEARTPFLDRHFVQNYLSIPYKFRYHKGINQCEKYLLRKAFENDNILPKEVLWRTKEAFSDGVSKHTRSWYTIIQEYCRRIFSIPQGLKENVFVEKNVKLMNITSGIIPKTLEQLHYRMIYDKYYKFQYNVVPYFWMPKFVEATDSSARTLNIYKEKTKHNINGPNTEKVQNEKIISHTE